MMLTDNDIKFIENYYANPPIDTGDVATIQRLLAHIRALESQAAPGTVVAGEGWRDKMASAISAYALVIGDSPHSEYQGMREWMVIQDLLAEVTELPAPDSKYTEVVTRGIYFSPNDGNCTLISNAEALKIASSLIAAATQPQKGTPDAQ